VTLSDSAPGSFGFQVVALTSDSDRVYWATGGEGGEVMALPTRGVNAWITASASGGNRPPTLEFDFDCSQASPPAPQSFTLTNTGSIEAQWAAVPLALGAVPPLDPGITFAPATSMLAPGASANVAVSVQWPPDLAQFGNSESGAIGITTGVVNVPTQYVEVRGNVIGYFPIWVTETPCPIDLSTQVCVSDTSMGTSSTAGSTTIGFGTDVPLNSTSQWSVSTGEELGSTYAPVPECTSDNSAFAVTSDGQGDCTITFTAAKIGAQRGNISVALRGSSPGGLCAPALPLAVTATVVAGDGGP
jgi:hypothetical protein